jgi:hypothetical protein
MPNILIVESHLMCTLSMPKICARLQWQGCTGTFTMIVPDEQLHFYRLCGTSMYSNVLVSNPPPPIYTLAKPCDCDSTADKIYRFSPKLCLWLPSLVNKESGGGGCAPATIEVIYTQDEWTKKTPQPNPRCRLFFKIDLLTDFAACV